MGTEYGNGRVKNLTSGLRNSETRWSATSSDATQSSDPIMASTKESDEETSPLKQKRQTDWQSMKHHWDVDFKSMEIFLEIWRVVSG